MAIIAKVENGKIDSSVSSDKVAAKNTNTNIGKSTLGYDEFLKRLTAEMQYLQVKLAYQVGREKKDAKSQCQIGPVEDFVNNAGLISAVKNIGNSIAEFEKFNRYMEALVAYHKFYGGKDA